MLSWHCGFFFFNKQVWMPNLLQVYISLVAYQPSDVGVTFPDASNRWHSILPTPWWERDFKDMTKKARQDKNSMYIQHNNI